MKDIKKKMSLYSSFFILIEVSYIKLSLVQSFVFGCSLRSRYSATMVFLLVFLQIKMSPVKCDRNYSNFSKICT